MARDLMPPSAADQPPGEPGPTRLSLREALVTIGRDLVAPVAIAATVAFALIPAPRLVAWFALLALAAALGRVSRPMGVTAAVASAMLFMTAHGRPRFASTITDTWTIRGSFLIGMLGALAAAAASWWAHERERRRQTTRLVAVPTRVPSRRATTVGNRR
jgi:hypothetical protein